MPGSSATDCPRQAVGYNDDSLAQDLNPPLTTVSIPAHELGRESVRLALAEVEAGGARGTAQDRTSWARTPSSASPWDLRADPPGGTAVIRGADRVAAKAARCARPDAPADPVPADGEPGVLVTVRGGRSPSWPSRSWTAPSRRSARVSRPTTARSARRTRNSA